METMVKEMNLREAAVEEIDMPGGARVKFKASAALPRIYRAMYGRDLFQDLQKLRVPAANKGGGVAAEVFDSLPMFEDLAYAMAKHADSGITESIEEWLGQFEMGAIIGIVPDLMELWGINQATTAVSKKNYVPVPVK